MYLCLVMFINVSLTNMNSTGKCLNQKTEMNMKVLTKHNTRHHLQGSVNEHGSINASIILAIGYSQITALNYNADTFLDLALLRN